MKRKYAMRLSFLLAVILSLSACGMATDLAGEETRPEVTTLALTTAPDENLQSTTVPVETEPTVPTMCPNADIVKDGRMQYTLIVSDDVTQDSTEMNLARTIVEETKRLSGTTVQIKTDWLRKGTSHDPNAYEILVGKTNYSETEQAAEGIGYGDCTIRAIGNKIVLFAYSDHVLSTAVSHFNIMLQTGTVSTTGDITIQGSQLDQVVTVNSKLNALPLFEGGEFYAYYEAGANCDELIFRNTDLTEYEAYLSKMEKSGFELYTTHQMGKNHFATFHSRKFTLTVGYYDYNSMVRILIEPLAPKVGLPMDNVYTPITTSQITMLGAAYESKGSSVGNGLSVLIRLTDGRFVIVDGGHSYAACARELRDALREQSAAYAKSDKDITIAAWIITHAHGDHHGVLNTNYQLFRTMKVERLLVNYLSETERHAALHSKEFGANWGSTEGKGDTTLAAAKALGATVHQVHVGQVFYLADLTMEVLYTIESFAPNICNALNTTSTVMRMQFGGEGGTTYLSTGDATGNGMEICADMYGDYLRSDIVQVCHHGYSTWGNDAGMIKAYKTVNAPTALWPQGYNAYLSSRTKEYNHVLFTVPAFREVLVSGSVGDQIILPIPYRVGSATVIRAPK